jgi:hypothetical protein
VPASPETAALAPLPSGLTPLLVYRATEPGADAASVTAQIGFLASVFERAAFRVSAKGGEKVAKTIALNARDAFTLPTSRLAVATSEPAGAFATVEIFSLP